MNLRSDWFCGVIMMASNYPLIRFDEDIISCNFIVSFVLLQQLMGSK